MTTIRVKMMITPHSTGQDWLSKLPSELLFNIFQRCPDFSSLWSLINTSSLMLSVFNSRGLEIVDAVLDSTVPVQTRLLMREVLAIHTGSFSCASYSEVSWIIVDRSRLLNRLIATPGQLRKFVRLSHKIHIMAHLCINNCIQRCLKSPLNQKEYPKSFEFPTWTEEQRTILAFWRALFFNELKIEGPKGHLNWSSGDLIDLDSTCAYHHFEAHTPLMQALTALQFIEELANPGCPKEFPGELSSRSFQLPNLPEDTEFGWTCQLPPSPRAVTQDCEPVSQSHNSNPKLRPETRPEPDSEEDEQSEEESSPEEDSSPESSSAPSPIVVQDLPAGLELIFRVRPYVPHLIQSFGQGPPGQEWQDLDRETIGVQFWRSMIGNPNAGPAKYMSFEGYTKYGFAIWEEQRMIDLGMWTSQALTDPFQYYRKWYTFLSEEDIARWKRKYRHYGDDDY